MTTRDDTVEIDIRRLAHLLELAKLGDVAWSQRRMRNGFRHVPVCSDPEHREPECFSCQTFMVAEEIIGDGWF